MRAGRTARSRARRPCTRDPHTAPGDGRPQNPASSCAGERWPLSCRAPFLVELLLFGRAAQRECRGGPTRDRLQHLVEVARPDLALMACRRVPVGLELELALLQLDIRGHRV